MKTSLLLLWVYWQAANNFTTYTATRSPRRKSPELGTGFSRSCWDSRWANANANNANARIIKWRLHTTFWEFYGSGSFWCERDISELYRN